MITIQQHPYNGPTIRYMAGTPGRSAYQTWLAQGHEGDETAFLAWLRGTSDISEIVLPSDISAALGGSETLADALLWLAQNGGGPLPSSPFWASCPGLIGVI